MLYVCYDSRSWCGVEWTLRGRVPSWPLIVAHPRRDIIRCVGLEMNMNGIMEIVRLGLRRQDVVKGQRPCGSNVGHFQVPVFILVVYGSR